MPSQSSIASVRTSHFSELTGVAGTANAALDISSAKSPVADLDTGPDATNGRYFIQRPTGGLGETNAHEVLRFAGTGAANGTFGCAAWGWSKTGADGIWVPSKLFIITGTLGSLTGVASHGNTDSDWFFPDTISVDVNNCPDGTCEAFGGTSADNGNLDLRFDGGNYPVLEIELADLASATAVRCWRAIQ